MMKRFAIVWLLLLTVPGFSIQAAQTTFVNDTTSTFYYNNGTSPDSPPIDAINFVNDGTFTAISGLGLDLPYETSSTLNFTNNGTMLGFPGFRFRTNPTGTGVAKPARSFHNDTFGTVDGSIYLRIQATNIHNRGTLTVGSSGVITMDGGNVDLAEGIVGVPSLASITSSDFYPYPGPADTNFFLPAIAIYDVAWSSTNLAPNVRQIDSADIWAVNDSGLTNATAPPASGAPAPSINFPGLALIDSLFAPLIADAHVTVLEEETVTVNDNALVPVDVTLPTQILKQGVVVAVGAGFSGAIRFDDGDVNVILSIPSTDPLTGVTATNAILLRDSMGSDDDRGRVVENALDGTFRPVNYRMARLGSIFNLTQYGTNGNIGRPFTNFFYTTEFMNPAATNLFRPQVLSETPTNIVTTNGFYAAYTALIDNVVTRPPNVTGGSFTNLPGSIRIQSEQLDLSNAKMVAQGQISIKAKHVVPATNIVLDVDNIAVDLGSTNGLLLVDGIIPDQITGRLRGTITAWSGYWTNTFSVELENYEVDDAGATVLVPLTNEVAVIYHALFVDATDLAGVLQPYVYDLLTHADHVSVNDSLILLQNFLLDARSATLNGSITVPGALPADPITGLTAPGDPLRDWVNTNAPKLLYLTNTAFLSFPNNISWGTDRARYAAIVNSGFASGASIRAHSWYFENTGSLFSQNLFELRFQTAVLSGNLDSGNLLRLNGQNLVLSNLTADVNGKAEFRVAGVLGDYGVSNMVSVGDGFSLFVKPMAGDLLATVIDDHSSKVFPSTVMHTWAGEDRGPTVEGFVNNTAIGRLVLSAASSGARFSFTGAGSPGTVNAMYVDRLEFGANVANFDASFNATNVIIGANMRIYYSQATTNGVSIAELLNGKNGGRFIWVPSYAGTFSGVDLDYSGTFYRFNQALAASSAIDSDNDGTVNSLDPTPINPEFSYVPTVNQPVFAALPFPDEFGAGGTGFAGAKGFYNGLFYRPSDIEAGSSGSFTATVSKNGNFTAKIRWAGAPRATYSFSGKFGADGKSTNNIPRSPFFAELELDLNGGNRITGNISDGDTASTLIADRSVYNNKSNRAPQRGRYTMVIPGTPDSATLPAGHGYGTVMVGTAGNVSWYGVLADGTKVSQSSTISEMGVWPLYAAFSGGSGVILGWMQFANEVETDFFGPAVWIKAPYDDVHPGGFRHESLVEGARYTPPPAATNVLISFSSGNLTAPITNVFRLGKNYKVSKLGSNRLSLSLSPSTGLFSGSVLDEEGATIRFNGAILEKARRGNGFFLGFDETGAVDLDLTP